MTNNQQDRRERIAAQVLAGLAQNGLGPSFAVADAIKYASLLIAEMDSRWPHADDSCVEVAKLRAEVERLTRERDEARAVVKRLKAAQSSQPEGWVIWDDSDDERPIRDRHIWHGLGVDPFESRDEAEASLKRYSPHSGLRVRRWPLDPSEDKEVQP